MAAWIQLTTPPRYERVQADLALNRTLAHRLPPPTLRSVPGKRRMASGWKAGSMIDASNALCLVLGTAAVAAGPIMGARSAPARSRLAAAAAAFHPMLVVGLFYSLAAHMHRRLGGWPERIGDAGFPDDLVMHANIAHGAFGALLLGPIGALRATGIDVISAFAADCWAIASCRLHRARL